MKRGVLKYALLSLALLVAPMSARESAAEALTRQGSQISGEFLRKKLVRDETTPEDVLAMLGRPLDQFQAGGQEKWIYDWQFSSGSGRSYYGGNAFGTRSITLILMFEDGVLADFVIREGGY